MGHGALAVVTGGASGIGRAIAHRAAIERGFHVAILDTHERELERVQTEILALGGSVSAIACDVSRAEDVDAVAKALLAERGAPRFVVCNAGVEYAGRLWDMTATEWRRLQAVNVDGAFHTARAFVPSMIAAPLRSRLLFTSSVGGVGIVATQGAYAVSKHAVRVLAQSFAADLEEIDAPVDVSILLPAAVRTPIFDRARTSRAADAEEFRRDMQHHLRADGMSPEEVAELVFLAIDEGKRWIYSHPERGAAIVREHVAELLSGVAGAEG